MEGSLERPELYGVIPRSAQAIFECLKQPQYKEHVVKCSYLEIYNEELRDLLVEGKHSQRAKLDIMECKDGGTFCRYDLLLLYTVAHIISIDCLIFNVQLDN